MEINKEQLAELLHNQESISTEHEELASDNGLIIINGESDDITSFLGAVDDETGGDDSFILKNKDGHLIILPDSNFQELKDLIDELNLDITIKKVVINAEWCPEHVPCSWLITTTDVPFANFDLMKDGELFCRGIVIDTKDVLKCLS